MTDLRAGHSPTLAQTTYIMKKASFLLLCMTAMIFAVTSCKKGDTGPQGEPGTANVMFSSWFTPNTYKKDTIFGLWGFSHTQAAPAITQAVLDSGSVLTFGKMLGYNPAIWPVTQVSQLPISINYMQGGYQTDTWQAFATVGNLRIRFTNSNNIYTSIANAHQFRYIIIPGGARAGRMAPLSYSELCRKYNIPE
jgi:hypothetical protein